MGQLNQNKGNASENCYRHRKTDSWDYKWTCQLEEQFRKRVQVKRANHSGRVIAE